MTSDAELRMKHPRPAFDELTPLFLDKIALAEVRFFQNTSLHFFGCNLDWAVRFDHANSKVPLE